MYRLLGFLLLQIFAKQIVGVFSIADVSAQLCILSLHIIISLLRFLIIALPLAYIFSLLPSGSTYVWAVLPIADGIACIAAVLLSKKACRVQNMEHNA